MYGWTTFLFRSWAWVENNGRWFQAVPTNTILHNYKEIKKKNSCLNKWLSVTVLTQKKEKCWEPNQSDGATDSLAWHAWLGCLKARACFSLPPNFGSAFLMCLPENVKNKQQTNTLVLLQAVFSVCCSPLFHVSRYWVLPASLLLAESLCSPRRCFRWMLRGHSTPHCAPHSLQALSRG